MGDCPIKRRHPARARLKGIGSVNSVAASARYTTGSYKFLFETDYLQA
jgi:hypothetical protein